MSYIKKHFEFVAILSLGLLLAIRIIFFLKDGTNNLVESILIWVIFFGSIFFLGYLAYAIEGTIRDFVYKYKDKFFIASFIILLEVGFFIDNKLEFNTVYIFSLLFIVMIVSLISLFLPKKVSKILDITFVVIYTLYVFAQDNYYRIFNDFFSFKEAGNVEEGLQFVDGMYKFSFIHVYFVVVCLVTIYLIYKYKNTSHLEFNKQTLKKVYLIPIFLFLLVNINAQYPVKSARLHLSDHYLYSSTFSKERFVSRFGTLNLLIKDGASALTPSFTTARDIEYIDNYYENNTKIHTENYYTNMFEGKNLIVIVGESLDTIAVDEFLTPNMYRLKAEGLDFQNHFTPAYPRTTCDTEVIFNTSIIPSIQDGPTCYVYNKNTYSHSLAELFNDEQYVTSAFHSNYKEFYTRDLVYEGFGYDYFYGQHELDLDETEKRFDSIFFEKSIDYAISEDENFFSFMLTLSGHSPYELSNIAVNTHYNTVDDYYGDTVPESIKLYIASQMETDVMIGKIFEVLEEKELLENTVIILTNDHYPYSLDQDDYFSYKNIEEDYMKNQGLMYIWASGIDHVEVTKLTSSFDFLPTINNMFNLGGDYSYYVGNDIFSNDYDPVVYFKDFSIYDGIDLYPLSSSKEPDNPDLLQLASDYYELCKKVLKVDYFKD